ncbi:MAG TPA: ribonuclease R [Xanthomonadales bacterium]|nr:ribonuclease R [Xanthomonadales bacterium]
MANKNNNKRINAKAPSRQDIIKLLSEQRRPVKRREIFERLDVISDDQREIMRRRLKAMLRDGQIVKNRRNAYGLPEKMDLVRGRISAHADGFGFVVPESGDTDLYLSSKQMRRVLHGDKVLAAVTGIDHRGRREGVITEILERANERIVGRFVRESGVALVVPDEPRINQDILIPLSETGSAKPGQVVVAKLTQQPGERQPPVGTIVEILGETGAPGMATEIAIRNLGLPHEWPTGVEQEAAAFGDEVEEKWKEGRKDLRDLPLVTIDGADARDFDDAVFAQRRKNSWRLVVAIADVASYVSPGSKLDDEAQERATSVYFPGRVIPMLPEELSNGLCSLNPDVDRLCLVCDMSIDNFGRVTRSRFDTAVMRSHARLTYDEVWNYLVSGKSEIRPGMDTVSASLRDLYGLYKALRKARTTRGAIDFESTEVKFGFDEDGNVENIQPVERNDAHKIIEECMVTANVQAARYLLRQEIPTLYRVHEPPQGDRIESLEQFLRGLGIKVTWRGRPEPRDFEQIVQRIKGRDDQHLIMAVLLRAQSLATYQATNHGHFGLALDAYAHFTSPIRRYPDLLVHRAIHYLQNKKNKGEFTYDMTRMNSLAEHCSHRSRRAEEAERDVTGRLKCHYMERHVGDKFEGRVSGVTSFGLFVELDRIAVSGLVHITALPNDYYHFDPVLHRLTGERSGKVFQLAQRVTVKVVAVNTDERKIDFEMER